jgi:lambda family phage portal protein
MLAPKPNIRALGWEREKGREWSRNVAAHFRTWAQSKDCDAARKHNFASLTYMVFRTGLVNGEALAIPLWLDRPRSQWKTCLSLIDPDRLGTPYQLSCDPKVRMGIEVDDFGAPVAYHISKRHPFDIGAASIGLSECERIPALTDFGRLRVIHVHDEERTGQTRGKPILSPVLGQLRMLSDYQRTEMKKAVVGSLIAAFVESPMSTTDLLDIFGGQAASREQAFDRYQKSRGGYDTQLEGGAVIPLYPGDKITPYNPQLASDVYKDFLEAGFRHVGAGVGMPLELVTKDFSRTSYAAVRAALMEAWRFFAGRRKWLTDNWLQPVYELWLEEAINRGLVEAPDFYDNRAAYTEAWWIGAARGYVDPVREASAAEMRMRIGLSTAEIECAEQGRDWEEVAEQRGHELATYRELGIPLAAVGQAGNAKDNADDKQPKDETDNGPPDKPEEVQP